jgi:hypothetical protein
METHWGERHLYTLPLSMDMRSILPAYGARFNNVDESEGKTPLVFPCHNQYL